ncbi:MAG: hypothetical protein JWO82_3466 [Akkermansiaceae bacterium]|nr:hypothetical protein [Akkermansiaceae bacterium]
MNIFLTGYTGNLGPALAGALTGHAVQALVRDPSHAPVLPHVKVVAGSFEDLPLSLQGEIEVIIHSAASTAFLAPLEDLRRTNVEGTARMLDFARNCPRLKKFVHVSTACVCGLRSGDIPEARLPRPPAFVNSYEQSKWEAEELIFESGLPAEIVRLSIVAGSERDGAVRSAGALHHTLFWLWKGLIPMMPGSADTPVDLISTEYAAEVVAACANAPLAPLRVIHGCAGDRAPSLGELLTSLTTIFSTKSAAWQRGSIAAPMMVDAETFALFEETVVQSGDLLFRRVCQDSKAFLPGLLHPRRYLTRRASELPCREPSSDWRSLAQLVTRHVIDSRS